MRNSSSIHLAGHDSYREHFAEADSRSSRRLSKLCRAFRRDESGNVIVWVAVAMVCMLSAAAFAVDVVHAVVIQRQLQVSADAAALADAEVLPNTTFPNYSANSAGKNLYGGVTVTETATPLCLATVASWGAPCTSSSPNAVQVTQTANVPVAFAGLFGVQSIPVSATSTASAKGAVPLPYNVAIIVDSTLSMNTLDGSASCSGLTQEQCALEGVRALLGENGNGQYGLAPSVDHVALFTFPNVITGSSAGVAQVSSGDDVAGTYNCTTSLPSTFSYNGHTYNYLQDSSNSSYYDSVLWSAGNDQANRGAPTPYNPPYTGLAWAMPYTFPPRSGTSYTPPSGTYGPTYQVVGFSSDYRTSNNATTLNSASNLVRAAAGVSGCGGIQPSNYDGNYGTYYAGAIYAAQAALLAEQPNNPGSGNVMIILGDGNMTAPSSSSSPASYSPAMPSSSSQATTTYAGMGSTPATEYTKPSSYLLAASSSTGSYPSWNGECGQAVTAAQYAATYSGNPTLVYSIAYGALTTSSSSNCASDHNTSASAYPNITPCQTMQDIATGPAYFYSDYNTAGGSTGCQATDKNNTVTTLVNIFHAISTDLTRTRLIPNNTQ